MIQSGFGGLYGTNSKFGDMDITGEGCLEFFTNRKKVTAKWAYPTAPVTATTTTAAARSTEHHMDVGDKANFNGVMWEVVVG